MFKIYDSVKIKLMAFSRPQILIQELINQNILTEEQSYDIQKQAIDQDKDYGQVLIEKGIIKDADLLSMKVSLYRLPSIDASTTEIKRESVKDIPENIIQLYKFIPFELNSSSLKVALLNPENIDALEALKFIAADKNVNLEKFLIDYKGFEQLRRGYGSLTSEVGKALETISAEKGDKELKISDKTESLSQLNAEAPATRIVATVVKHAVETKASDIHIEPFDDVIRLRFRVDGVLQTALTLPLNLLSSLVTRIKILSDLKIDETRLAQDGRFSTKMFDRTIDFRVSTFPTRTGEKVVLRILDPIVGTVQLTDLGLQGRNLNLLLEGIAKPFGMILITGPTGSGKSTTLAALLRQMNAEGINIVTLEDPVEYYIKGVNQSQVHEEIGYTFASGLRHILRQDPDVIMVGEIRDHETAALAVQASLTGHMVLSTLHTNDTIGVIPRLIDMAVERYLIAPTLSVAMAQRLVRRLCQECHIKDKANPSEEALIKKALEDIPSDMRAQFAQDNFEVYKAGDGCPKCNGKAYKGRVGIFEVLAMNDEIEKIILSKISEAELRTAAKRQGMISMYQDGIMKVLQGLTSLEEILQASEESNETEV